MFLYPGTSIEQEFAIMEIEFSRTRDRKAIVFDKKYISLLRTSNRDII
jgi:hypothetical protein